MDDKKTVVFKQEKANVSGIRTIMHEESSDGAELNAENCDKKKLTTDIDCGLTSGSDVSSAQDKQGAPSVTGVSMDDEDFSLRLESSDEEAFKDTLEVKSAVSNKSDTLFSDIESSDDSIVYEPKSTVSQGAEKKYTNAIPESLVEEKKVTESEFDLVESDEEFFEDLPLPEKSEQEETISEKDEKERNSTPLIDEENDKSTELDLQLQAVNTITESNIQLSGNSNQSMDLALESSCESVDPSSRENVMTSTEIAPSHNLADDKSMEVDDKDSPIGLPLDSEEREFLPTSSLLLEQKGECPISKPDLPETEMIIPESSEETSYDTTVSSPQVSINVPTPKENTEKLVKVLQTADFDTSKSSRKVQEVSHDPTIPVNEPDAMQTDVQIPNEGDFEESSESSKEVQVVEQELENISMSPTLLEDENISPSVQPETMDTEVEITEELNQDCDEKMEKNLLQQESNESFASENKNLEVEEHIQIDKTMLEVSVVSEIEANEGNANIEESGSQFLHQNVSQESTEKEAHLEVDEEQEIKVKSDEAFEENNEVPVVENTSDTEEHLIKKPIEKSTESTEINDKLMELEESQQKPNETIQTSQDLKEADILNKSENSPLNESLEEFETTKIDDKLVTSPKLPCDNEMKEVDSTQTENSDDVIKSSNEVAELSEKPEDVVKSQKENLDETEKFSEESPSSLDHIAKTSGENNKNCPEDQMKESTEMTMELQNTDVDGTSQEVIEKKMQTFEKSNEKITEFEEKEESPKKIEEPAVDVMDITESPPNLVETLDESNIQLSDSTEEHESNKEIVEHIEESKDQEESRQDKLLKTSEESSEDAKQQNAENKESAVETAELVNKSDVPEGDSIETSKSLENIEQISEGLTNQEKDTEDSPQSMVDKIEKPETEKPETESIEKQENNVCPDIDSIENQEPLKEAVSQKTDSSEKPELLNETAVSKETDSIEKQESPKEIAVSKEADSNESPGEISESQEADSTKNEASLNNTAVSKVTSESEKSEEIEPIKSSNVISSNKESLKETMETPEVVTEAVIEKVVEVSTPVESTKDNEITDSGRGQDTRKPPAKLDPEIIEIDDDDDFEEEKKLENTLQKDEKALESTSQKDSEDKKIDDEKKGSENKEVSPMDVDEEITTEKSSQKPAAEAQTITTDAKTDQESAVKENDAPIKDIPVQVLDDDDEPLLMIDTSHKEDNDTESNFMDNETATSAPTTDSSSDGSLELFYDKECVNYECKRATKNFYRATVFAMNFFKISKKRTKTQFVCEDCYDRALSSYEELCKTLKLKQPLLHGTTFKCQEFVEIIDSSDEDESDTTADKVKVSDENALPKESIEMLEAELEGAIRKVMHSVDIQNQLSWTKQILQQRLTNLQDDSDFVSEQLRALQRKADHMHNSLYQCPKIKLRQLTPLDLNSGRMYNPESDNSTSIPLPGDIIRNPICLNEQYYAVKTKAIASWVPCKVIEEVEGYPSGYNQTKTYKIKFTKLAKYPMFKTVYAKHMAYFDPPNVRLPIGSRVIAYFDATSLSRGKEKMLIPSAFYPGIIAEPLKQSNKFRYLVFYDDGYFQYVNHKDVRLVCQASENVWEDVHHQSREFIHNYLTQYAVNRPMVQTQKGQSMLVDYNGKWIYARVIDVDCSLVQMLFEGQSRSEWIYRGSTRLGPVYKESNNLSQKNTLNATRRRTEPFIRYINGDDSSSSQQVQENEQPQAKAGNSEIRSVAKKSVSRVDTSNNNSTAANSTAQPVPTVRHLNNSTIFVDDDNKPKGKVVYYTARKNLPPRNYIPHICNPSCPFNITHNLSFYSPLAKPLLSGWERQVFRQKSKKFIVYRGPCGKRLRNIEELHRYLRVTDNELNVDNFDFSADTNCLAEYVLEKCLVNKKDISCGKEKMPIPCVNYYDETMPPACEYSAVRIPTEGVPLNLDEEFMCGCDCEDDCSDKTKCACWNLTYAGAKYGMPTVPTEMVGYQYKRLYEHVPTGIYECNSRCKCKANCVNRVVQQPLQSKLQVFKTSNRGWGLRCINDVPRGSFICVYAGQMLTEQVANEGGLDAGDEYFAELDYIEVAEQIKEGYESDVQEPEEDEDLYNPERDDDDMDFRAPGESFKDKEFNTRLRTRRGNKNSTDGEFDSQERQVISFEPNKNMDTSNEPNEKPTIRKLFGKDESCYVMDAKVRGNLGRYFNHSCSPNLFVQNVFVDTHDLRFPWVAFFASTHIRAGTELTWNYNYEVGVVPGKVLYCQCGAPNCRQRLL